jgi:hypothetical protein
VGRAGRAFGAEMAKAARKARQKSVCFILQVIYLFRRTLVDLDMQICKTHQRGLRVYIPFLHVYHEAMFAEASYVHGLLRGEVSSANCRR